MPVGRPPKWKSPQEVEALGNEYFSTFEEGGKNFGKPITITGLAYALDTTRETLCNYQDKDEYSDTISKLKMRAELYAEERLYEGAATGPIFALKNFGWKDSQDLNHGGQKDNPVVMALPENDRAALEHYFKIKGMKNDGSTE